MFSEIESAFTAFKRVSIFFLTFLLDSQVCKEDNNDDIVDLEEDPDNQETRIYLNSKQVMTHFASQFQGLAQSINKSSLISGAQVLDPKIMCHEERQDESSLGKENSINFIPTVEVGFWPMEGVEWHFRNRSKVRDSRTKVVYEWPPSDVVHQYQQIGCNLVPVGFFNPKRDNSKVMP